jgi:hypothetical protein
MAGKIYLLNEGGSLQTMTEQPYENEALLQGLLGAYPDLMAGDQMDENTPRRWLLISREVGVPIEEEGSGWLSLDHLFVDQDAIPTLVEVKRSSNTRARREVVGQMLDYASNAVAYWSVDRLRTQFEAICEDRDEDPDLLVAALIESDLEDDAPVDEFWERVATNLKAGKIRLVFLADEIPPELRRIVEFLNTYTTPVEVLAVEVRQYVGEGLKTLVPRLIGQTAVAQARKSGAARQGKMWDRETILEEIANRQGEGEADVAAKILDWARGNVTKVKFGRGAIDGTFSVSLVHGGNNYSLFSVWTTGSFWIAHSNYKNKPAFASDETRADLVKKLKSIDGISLSDKTGKGIDIISASGPPAPTVLRGCSALDGAR